MQFVYSEAPFLAHRMSYLKEGSHKFSWNGWLLQNVYSRLRRHWQTLIRYPEVRQAVDKLKSAISAYPLVPFPIFNQPFTLETDVSTIRIAAVLMQNINKNKVLILAASRTLIEAKFNDSTVEREALAVVWGINYYRPYLFGRTFLVSLFIPA